MAYYGPTPSVRDLHYKIIADHIKRDPVGQNLGAAARSKAICFAVDNWPAHTGSGEAAQIGIRHAITDVLK